MVLISKTFYRTVAVVIMIITVMAVFFLKANPDKRRERVSASDETTLKENSEIVFDNEFLSINNHIDNSICSFEETRDFDRQIERFLKRWEIKGASLAIMKDEQLVYFKGYGWANEEDSVKMEPSHVMRIASLSKLITATAIMKLCQENTISLNDKVFGESGILNDPLFMNIRDKRAKNITIENLLRHQAGFTMHRGDPLFTVREIMIWDDLDEVPTMDDIIVHVLKQRLGFVPGTSSKYSNVGYLILSKVIEKVSGLTYEQYCKEHILSPAGCYDIHLANNLYHQRRHNEVRYYEPSTATPILPYNKHINDSLPRSYGGNNIEGLYGAGGWVASPVEILKFVASIDGKPDVPDILSIESIEYMIDREGGKPSIGWSNSGKNVSWSRTGSLAGTSAMIKVQNNGLSWVFITNTSCWKGSDFTRYIDSQMRNTLSRIAEFPALRVDYNRMAERERDEILHPVPAT